jgi:hypothetical protein
VTDEDCSSSEDENEEKEKEEESEDEVTRNSDVQVNSTIYLHRSSLIFRAAKLPS